MENRVSEYRGDNVADAEKRVSKTHFDARQDEHPYDDTDDVAKQARKYEGVSSRLECDGKDVLYGEFEMSDLDHALFEKQLGCSIQEDAEQNQRNVNCHTT